jgi:hypothetical protein
MLFSIGTNPCKKDWRVMCYQASKLPCCPIHYTHDQLETSSAHSNFNLGCCPAPRHVRSHDTMRISNHNVPFLLDDTAVFWTHMILPFVLLKKIKCIRYKSYLKYFSNKITHNKINDNYINFWIKWMVKCIYKNQRFVLVQQIIPQCTSTWWYLIESNRPMSKGMMGMDRDQVQSL